MLDNQVKEIRRNFEFFQSVVGTIMADHAGEIALIHGQNIVGYFPSADDAVHEGAKRFGSLPFSVQRVINRPIDLGFLSHATDNGCAV
jgi:pyruvate/oxaloacetate carboxyltransferase